MEHEIATYFEEHEEEAVTGFTVIDTCDDEYHIAEKWSRPSTDKWVQYHITADELAARINQEKCEKRATLTDDQFAKVCEQIDHPEVTPEKVTA